ncbi:hypothetical protein Q5752_000877 [Cryptotrichosporon argae]
MSIRPSLKKSASLPGSSHPFPPISPPSAHPPLQSAMSTSHVHMASDDSVGASAGASSTPTLVLVAGGAAKYMPRTSTVMTSGSVDGKYRRKVGFEAFEAGPDALFAFTCQAKSEGYKRSRSTRVFLVAVSPDETGEDALDWLMSELVEDGDEVVALRVIELGEEERQSAKNQEELKEDAHTLLSTILNKNNEEYDRRISVIVEFVAGRATDMILKMIALYRPDSLVVGTKGQQSRLQSWGRALGAPGMGSVSRFVVSHSPVPVIVVRPERKVKKTLQKRQNDPKRGQYAALVGPDDVALSRSRSRERSRSMDRTRTRSAEGRD